MIPCSINGVKFNLNPEQIIKTLNSNVYWDFKLNTDSYDLDCDYKTKEEAIEKAYELYQDKIMDNGYQLDIDICEYMVGDGDPVILREFTETLELDEEEFYNEYEEHNINHLLIYSYH